MNIENKEIKLLDVIDSFNELKNRRIQQSIEKRWAGNRFIFINKSDFPPFMIFKYKKENNQLSNKIMEIISKYNGTIKWVVKCEKNQLGNNVWMIYPSLISEVMKAYNKDYNFAKEYIATNEPSLSKNAYQDLDRLSQFLEAELVYSGFTKRIV